MSELITAQQVNELVDRFYARLVEDDYFHHLFSQRGVDIELLKERQRSFIARIANPASSQERQGEIGQVRERHHFGISREGSERWFAHMTDAVGEMELEPKSKQALLQKIQYLLKKMLEQPKEAN
jgi:truncated hemoglobin YjbI